MDNNENLNQDIYENQEYNIEEPSANENITTEHADELFVEPAEIYTAELPSGGNDGEMAYNVYDEPSDGEFDVPGEFVDPSEYGISEGEGELPADYEPYHPADYSQGQNTQEYDGEYETGEGPQYASFNGDDMPFSQAFAAARAEMGPGHVFTWRGHTYNTYYKSEWDAMSANEQHAFTQEVYGAAPHNDFEGVEEPMYAMERGIVNDDMSFSQAFAAAREAMGPGGSFTWHGHVYGTYYRHEWNAMSPEEQHQFTLSAINGHHDNNFMEEPLYAEETFDGNDSLDVTIVGMDTYEVDGQNVNLATLDVDGQSVYMIDLDNDNVFDYAIADVDGSGEILDSNADMVDISDAQISVDDINIGLMDADPGIDLV